MLALRKETYERQPEQLTLMQSERYMLAVMFKNFKAGNACSTLTGLSPLLVNKFLFVSLAHAWLSHVLGHIVVPSVIVNGDELDWF